MVQKFRVVRLLRNGELQLVAGQNVVTEFVMNPSECVCNVRVLYISLPGGLRPLQSRLKVASLLSKSISEIISSGGEGWIDLQGLLITLFGCVHLALNLGNERFCSVERGVGRIVRYESVEFQESFIEAPALDILGGQIYARTLSPRLLPQRFLISRLSFMRIPGLRVSHAHQLIVEGLFFVFGYTLDALDGPVSLLLGDIKLS